MGNNLLMKKKETVSVKVAQERLRQIEIKPGTEIIGVSEALGRICAQDVYAVINQPPFPRSPLDGYAVRSQDTQGASIKTPVKLKVIEHICAGMYPSKKVESGEAVKIMTGAPIPEGADGIIKQELTDEGNENVELYESVQAYGNYCFQGEDVKQGMLLFEKGVQLRYMHVGIMASQGMENIEVYALPKIGIMATGDELISAGQPLIPGKIYDSNGPLLEARVSELGCSALRLKSLRDDARGLAEAVKSAIGHCNALITSGGVSVGVRDCMPDVAKLLNAEVLFHGINAKPGSPMMVMVIEGKLVFCLSGNPFAAAATFEVLVRPVLERMRGREEWKPQRVWGKLNTAFQKPSAVRRYVRGRIEDGIVWLPEGRHSSGMLASMAGCNCLVDIPGDSGKLDAGASVEVILL